jgi:uncharacterized OB-fold protein
VPRPIPIPDAQSKPFWDACNERRLVIQRCAACGRHQFPPEATCRDCDSADQLGWVETSGRGHIHGYMVMHDSRIKAFQPEQPYNLVGIALDDDPAIKFISNLPGVPVHEVPIGAAVEVDFIEVSPTQLMPEWRIVG